MTCAELKVIYQNWRRSQVDAAMANAAHIAAPLPPFECGFVVWAAWWRYKFTLVDAIYTALAFTHTDISDEWVLIGPSLMPLIRSMHRFEERVPTVNEAGFVLLGTIKNIQVFYNPEMVDPDVLTHDIWPRVNFICGNGKWYTPCVSRRR